MGVLKIFISLFFISFFLLRTEGVTLDGSDRVKFINALEQIEEVPEEDELDSLDRKSNPSTGMEESNSKGHKSDQLDRESRTGIDGQSKSEKFEENEESQSDQFESVDLNMPSQYSQPSPSAPVNQAEPVIPSAPDEKSVISDDSDEIDSGFSDSAVDDGIDSKSAVDDHFGLVIYGSGDAPRISDGSHTEIRLDKASVEKDELSVEEGSSVRFIRDLSNSDVVIVENSEEKFPVDSQKVFSFVSSADGEKKSILIVPYGVDNRRELVDRIEIVKNQEKDQKKIRDFESSKNLLYSIINRGVFRECVTDSGTVNATNEVLEKGIRILEKAGMESSDTYKLINAIVPYDENYNVNLFIEKYSDYKPLMDAAIKKHNEVLGRMKEIFDKNNRNLISVVEQMKRAMDNVDDVDKKKTTGFIESLEILRILVGNEIMEESCSVSRDSLIYYYKNMYTRFSTDLIKILTETELKFADMIRVSDIRVRMERMFGRIHSGSIRDLVGNPLLNTKMDLKLIKENLDFWDSDFVDLLGEIKFGPVYSVERIERWIEDVRKMIDSRFKNFKNFQIVFNLEKVLDEVKLRRKENIGVKSISRVQKKEGVERRGKNIFYTVVDGILQSLRMEGDQDTVKEIEKILPEIDKIFSEGKNFKEMNEDILGKKRRILDLLSLSAPLNRYNDYIGIKDKIRELVEIALNIVIPNNRIVEEAFKLARKEVEKNDKYIESVPCSDVIIEGMDIMWNLSYKVRISGTTGIYVGNSTILPIEYIQKVKEFARSPFLPHFLKNGFPIVVLDDFSTSVRLLSGISYEMSILRSFDEFWMDPVFMEITEMKFGHMNLGYMLTYKEIERGERVSTTNLSKNTLKNFKSAKNENDLKNLNSDKKNDNSDRDENSSSPSGKHGLLSKIWNIINPVNIVRKIISLFS